MPKWLHIHWYKIVNVHNKYNLGGFYTQRIVKECRCGARKIQLKGEL